MTDGSPNSERAEQIIASRMKLRQRFLKQMEQTPALSDDQPMGSGEINRHGMPKLPPDQYETAPGKWPVLDLGFQPHIPLDKWALKIDGLVKNPVTLSWDDFMNLEQVTDVNDFHCVTKWSKMDMTWVGVKFSTLAALAEPDDEAQHVMCHGYDNYTTNVPLAEALKDDVLLVHTVEGEPLPREHGGPVRMITPQLWAWKGSKWVNRLEFMKEDKKGFWEVRGYSNTAHPWRNDRYS